MRRRVVQIGDTYHVVNPPRLGKAKREAQEHHETVCTLIQNKDVKGLQKYKSRITLRDLDLSLSGFDPYGYEGLLCFVLRNSCKEEKLPKLQMWGILRSLPDCSRFVAAQAPALVRTAVLSSGGEDTTIKAIGDILSCVTDPEEKVRACNRQPGTSGFAATPPLRLAWRNLRVAQYLVECKAEVSRKILDEACELGASEFYTFLHKHGARPTPRSLVNAASGWMSGSGEYTDGAGNHAVIMRKLRVELSPRIWELVGDQIFNKVVLSYRIGPEFPTWTRGTVFDFVLAENGPFQCRSVRRIVCLDTVLEQFLNEPSLRSLVGWYALPGKVVVQPALLSDFGNEKHSTSTSNLPSHQLWVLKTADWISIHLAATRSFSLTEFSKSQNFNTMRIRDAILNAKISSLFEEFPPELCIYHSHPPPESQTIGCAGLGEYSKEYFASYLRKHPGVEKWHATDPLQRLKEFAEQVDLEREKRKQRSIAQHPALQPIREALISSLSIPLVLTHQIFEYSLPDLVLTEWPSVCCQKPGSVWLISLQTFWTAQDLLRSLNVGGEEEGPEVLKGSACQHCGLSLQKRVLREALAETVIVGCWSSDRPFPPDLAVFNFWRRVPWFLQFIKKAS